MKALNGCILDAVKPPAEGGAGGGCSTFFVNAASCSASAVGLSTGPAGFCLGLQTAPTANDLRHFLTLSCGAAPDAGPRPPPLDAGAPDGP